MFKKLLQKYNYWFRDPFTVGCDLSPFHASHNERERLIKVHGWFKAKSVANKWIRKHYWGSARIISGHHEWSKEEDPNGFYNYNA